MRLHAYEAHLCAYPLALTGFERLATGSKRLTVETVCKTAHPFSGYLYPQIDRTADRG